MVAIASSFVAAQILFFGVVAVNIWLDRTHPRPMRAASPERVVRPVVHVPLRVRVHGLAQARDRSLLPYPYPLPRSYLMTGAVTSPSLRPLPADAADSEELRTAA